MSTTSANNTNTTSTRATSTAHFDRASNNRKIRASREMQGVETDRRFVARGMPATKATARGSTQHLRRKDMKRRRDVSRAQEYKNKRLCDEAVATNDDVFAEERAMNEEYERHCEELSRWAEMVLLDISVATASGQSLWDDWDEVVD